MMKGYNWVQFAGVLMGGCVGFFGGGLLASNPVVIDLDYGDLKSYILEKNGQVKATQWEIDAANSRSQMTRRLRGGQLTASFGVDGIRSEELSNGRVQPVGSLDWEMPLYRGGQDAQEAIEQTEVALAHLRREHAIADRLAKAQSAYWNIVYADEMIRNSQRILRQNIRSYQSAKRRFNRGLIPSSDLMVFEIYEDQLNEQVESFRHEKKIVSIRLKAILGLPETSTIRVTMSELPHVHSDTALVGQLPESTIGTREFELNLRRVELKRDLTVGKLSPSVDLIGKYGLYNESERSSSHWIDRTEALLGARFNLMLWDGQQLDALVDADAKGVRAQLVSTTHQRAIMAAELDASNEELIHLRELIHASEQRVTKSARLLRTIIQDYDRGVKDSTDVLSTLQMVAQVQETYAQQRRDYQLKLANLQTL